MDGGNIWQELFQEIILFFVFQIPDESLVPVLARVSNITWDQKHGWIVEQKYNPLPRLAEGPNILSEICLKF